jgi:trk system potassium uptake protein TrkH
VNIGGMKATELTEVTKVFLSFMMWVGRLEVVIALMMFTRTFWSELFKDARGSRRSAKNKRF